MDFSKNESQQESLLGPMWMVFYWILNPVIDWYIFIWSWFLAIYLVFLRCIFEFTLKAIDECSRRVNLLNVKSNPSYFSSPRAAPLPIIEEDISEEPTANENTSSESNVSEIIVELISTVTSTEQETPDVASEDSTFEAETIIEEIQITSNDLKVTDVSSEDLILAKDINIADEAIDESNILKELQVDNAAENSQASCVNAVELKATGDIKDSNVFNTETVSKSIVTDTPLITQQSEIATENLEVMEVEEILHTTDIILTEEQELIKFDNKDKDKENFENIEDTQDNPVSTTNQELKVTNLLAEKSRSTDVEEAEKEINTAEATQSPNTVEVELIKITENQIETELMEADNEKSFPVVHPENLQETEFADLVEKPNITKATNIVQENKAVDANLFETEEEIENKPVLKEQGGYEIVPEDSVADIQAKTEDKDEFVISEQTKVVEVSDSKKLENFSDVNGSNVSDHTTLDVPKFPAATVESITEILESSKIEADYKKAQEAKVVKEDVSATIEHEVVASANVSEVATKFPTATVESITEILESSKIEADYKKAQETKVVKEDVSATIEHEVVESANVSEVATKFPTATEETITEILESSKIDAACKKPQETKIAKVDVSATIEQEEVQSAGIEPQTNVATIVANIEKTNETDLPSIQTKKSSGDSSTVNPDHVQKVEDSGKTSTALPQNCNAPKYQNTGTTSKSQKRRRGNR